MTSVKRLDLLTKPMLDLNVVEGADKDSPVYKLIYIDGTYVTFKVLVVGRSPEAEPPMTPEQFVNSSASSGRVELDDASMTESRRMNCKDCP